MSAPPIGITSSTPSDQREPTHGEQGLARVRRAEITQITSTTPARTGRDDPLPGR